MNTILTNDNRVTSDYNTSKKKKKIKRQEVEPIKHNIKDQMVRKEDTIDYTTIILGHIKSKVYMKSGDL